MFISHLLCTGMNSQFKYVMGILYLYKKVELMDIWSSIEPVESNRTGVSRSFIIVKLEEVNGRRWVKPFFKVSEMTFLTSECHWPG